MSLTRLVAGENSQLFAVEMILAKMAGRAGDRESDDDGFEDDRTDDPADDGLLRVPLALG